MSLGSSATSESAEHATSSDRAYGVLQSMRALGPGAHPLRRIIDAAQLSRSTVQRRLTEMVRADLCRELPGKRGYYELTLSSAASVAHDLDGLIPLLPQIERELIELQKYTGHGVVLHGRLAGNPPARLCVAYRDGTARALTHALECHPEAKARLRLAPLDTDAPGWVIAGGPADPSCPTPPPGSVSATPVVRSGSPLPDWDLLSVPVLRDGKIAAALSILAPAHSMKTSHPFYRAALNGCRWRLSRHLRPTAMPSFNAV
jgi:DNA-binding IclR family transcriptional regulator